MKSFCMLHDDQGSKQGGRNEGWGGSEGVVLTRILSSLLFELRTDIELARFMLWNRETDNMAL